MRRLPNLDRSSDAVSRAGSGCRRGRPRRVPSGRSPWSRSRSCAPTTPGRRSAHLGSGNPVVLGFGDIHFEGVLSSKLAESPSTVLSPIAPTLGRADIAVANLETAVTNTGAAAAKQFVFAPLRAFEALRGGSLDVVSMANNHGMDYGESGLKTLWLRRSATASRSSGSGSTASAPTLPTAHGRGQRSRSSPRRRCSTTTSSRRGAPAQEARPRLRERAAAVAGGAPAGAPTPWSSTCTGASSSRAARPPTSARSRATLGARERTSSSAAAHRLLGGGRMGDAFVDYGLELRLVRDERELDADWRALRDRDRPPHRLLPLGARAHRRRRPEATGRRGEAVGDGIVALAPHAPGSRASGPSSLRQASRADLLIQTGAARARPSPRARSQDSHARSSASRADRRSGRIRRP